MDVGVIGVGIMGRNHARVYSELKQVDALWITDLNTQAASDVAKANDGHVASGVDTLLYNFYAVRICVPTPFTTGLQPRSFPPGSRHLSRNRSARP